MKIAIMLSGLTRKHESGLASIERWFKGHDVDVFCQSYTFKNLEMMIRDTWSKATTEEYYSKLDLSIDQVLSLYSPKLSRIEDYDFVSVLFTFMFLEIMNHPGMFMQNLSGNLTIISMHYGMMVVNGLRKHYEATHNVAYDLVIRMRYDSDIFHMAPIEQYDLTKLNIPSGRDWGGINDQFAFGPPDLMDKYMNLFPEIVETAKKTLRYHPETLLMEHLERQDLMKDLLRPNMIVNITMSRDDQMAHGVVDSDIDLTQGKY